MIRPHSFYRNAKLQVSFILGENPNSFRKFTELSPSLEKYKMEPNTVRSVTIWTWRAKKSDLADHFKRPRFIRVSLRSVSEKHPNFLSLDIGCAKNTVIVSI